MDADASIQKHDSVKLDQCIVELVAEKDGIQADNHRLSQIHLSLERRNNAIIEKLQIQTDEQQKRLNEHIALFHKTEKECQNEIFGAQAEIEQNYRKAEAVIIGHKKTRNHLRLNMQEKKEVDERRLSMLAQGEKLTQELKDAMKECRKKLDAFDREQYTQHRTKSPE
jgi:hypothetical protein